jgi:hypothetical protein
MVVALSGCGGGGGDVPPPQQPAQPPPTPPPGNPAFIDFTGPSNINYRFGLSPRAFSTSGEDQSYADQAAEIAIGGAAAGDYDNDGDIDVFITRGDLEPNLLYRNEGGLVFVDVAAAAGVAYTKSASDNWAHSGPTFADRSAAGLPPAAAAAASPGCLDWRSGCGSAASTSSMPVRMLPSIVGMVCGRFPPGSASSGRSCCRG